ncbi:hypothetical protein NBG84_21565 [Streptomyces sp. CWNU-1]|uniref:Secreted protein n=2 Tax=Streptomyces albipurpureus TaxID=2897419 RepID=A0ABT0UR78_9ACTN|nr:hypothetical protein [Streptomyces sp. CWNU-1]MCM2390856.1 hypothetical protein [Streptomyces sp. CWNU-1]
MLAGATTAAADSTPSATASAADLAAARKAATAPATVDTLSRFFARDGAVARSAAAPRAEGTTVPVYSLSPAFVAGKAGASVAQLEFLATQAVSSDGQKASVWAARQGSDWQVVNIATGDDEFRYAQLGASKLAGGTVFREPQIDAWYVSKGAKVLPLDEDAVRAVGTKGTTLAAYRDRVRAAYADKLPGSAYAKKGVAGGYDHSAQAAAPAPATAPKTATATSERDSGVLTASSVAVGAGAVLAASLCGVTAVRLRRRA